MSLSTEETKCIACGLCNEVCPVKIIKVQKGASAVIRSDKRHLCLRCGQCMAICPSRYIQVDGLSYDENFSEIRPYGFGEKEFVDFLASRRSVRNFDERSVPEDVIKRVINSVNYAPFGSHPEKSHLTVVSHRKTIETALPMISRFLDRIVFLIENPLASFFFKRSSSPELYNTVKNHLYPLSKSGTYKLENGDRITRGAPAMILFHSDITAEARTANSLINASYVMLHAHALGLGATMVEIVPAAINQVKELKTIFNIPENHEVSMSVVLGYPKYKYKRSVSRPVQTVDWI